MQMNTVRGAAGYPSRKAMKRLLTIGRANSVAAVLLLGTEIACGFGFFEGWRAGHKWLAYGSMMVFLGVVYLVHSVAK